MSTTNPAASSAGSPQRGLPRWAWILIILLIIIAVVALTAVVFAPRGREAARPPSAPGTASTATTSATASPSASSASPSQTPEAADGCLGGPAPLDQAVLAAQKKAPLSATGAAAFTATLMRWAYSTPAPPYQRVTAKQILTRDAKVGARRSLSVSHDPEGSTVTLDFSDGRYYVESFDGDSAIVSWVATGRGTANGEPLADAWIGGAVRLQALNGTWHYRDLTLERQINDLLQTGSAYSGGC